MGEKSSIEWTEATWNPVTGCTKISEGCDYCYAERMSKRLKAMGQPHYSNGFNLDTHPHAFKYTPGMEKTQDYFCKLMSELFPPGVPI